MEMKKKKKSMRTRRGIVWCGIVCQQLCSSTKKHTHTARNTQVAVLAMLAMGTIADGAGLRFARSFSGIVRLWVW